MNKQISAPIGAVLGLTALLAGGCQSSTVSTPKAQAAAMTIFYDGSASTAMMASPAFADAAIDRVGNAVMRQQLGDEFRIVTIGLRSTERAVDALSLASDRQLRLPAIRKRVEARLHELMAQDRQHGGDAATNILYTLQNAQPKCTPGSTVVVLSDGIEQSDAYSASKALSAGQPVRLPPASTPYLKNCSVAFVGIGMSPQSSQGGAAQTLPDKELQALISGWRDYLASAGVRPDDMSFTSII